MPTQFRDASGQERLLGTIFVPGATVGDVFTVQANGSLSPAPGGGSQPVTLAAVNVSSADLLASVPATGASWPLLLPALSGRQYYVIHTVVFHFRAGATPYNTDATVGLFSPADDMTWANGMIVGFSSADDTYTIGGPFGEGGGGSENVPASAMEGAAVALYIGSALTDGDGTLTVRLFYSVIDGAPA